MPQQQAIWIGRPDAKAHTFEQNPAPVPQNPALRGLALAYLTRVLVASPFIQNIFYSNAGFTKLRNHAALKEVHARADPTVIKTDLKSPQDIQSVLDALLKEDFSGRVVKSSRFPSAWQYHQAYKTGKLTPSAVVEALLPLVRKDIKNATKHSIAFMETHVDELRQRAAESTARYEAGKPLSPLDGVPVVYKDQLDMKGYKLVLGSNIDSTHKDDVDTYCVLPWQQAGALVLGKVTMHEYGMDTTNLNPVHGTPRNPYNEGYFTGGSSGGSAYALASGLVPIAHGADGGGSIRLPSNFCGVYGLKPTHDRVSFHPSISLANTVGVHGPMAANMVDLELAYRLIAHPNAQDLKSSRFIAPKSVTALQNRSKILGIDRAWLEQADTVVREAVLRAIDWLVITLDYKLIDITLPILHEAQLAHALTIVCEVAAGVPDISKLTAPNQILLSAIGQQATAIDFIQAQKARNVLMEHLTHLFDRFPGMIVVSPTTAMAGWPIVPSSLAYGQSDGNSSIKSMTYVSVANFTGTPAITSPVGYAQEKDGPLPIGLMGMGEWCSEDELLAFGYDCERYLHEALEGGRPLPGNWVDVFKLAGQK